MVKVGLGLLAAFVVTIAAAGLAFDATVATGSAPVNQPWAQHQMEFVAIIIWCAGRYPMYSQWEMRLKPLPRH